MISKKTKIIGAIILILILAGGVFYFLKNKRASGPKDEKITLEQAAQIGEKTTHKLLVQIEEPKGRPEDLKGRYERGDIVLIAPGDKEFSEAEVSGFLIIKMDLTEKQAEMLVRSKETETGEKDESGQPMTEQLKRRKYSVDLGKAGIAPDDFAGREISGRIFKWDIVSEKL
jgi:hypothetical protein